mmetsp:Transcript_14886/g.51151  ORF Transcript_14886/g.51151 Transcript_14886/m.51151 type:complete len:332 (-) Transcript_14886:34-1029(-)
MGGWGLRLACGCCFGACFVVVAAAAVFLTFYAWRRAPPAWHACLSDPRVATYLRPGHPTNATADVLAEGLGVHRAAILRQASALKAERHYYLFHKPLGCISQRDGSESSVYHFLPPGFPHVPHVGRLDKDTTGLLLFTDDRKLAEAMLTAEQCRKVYRVVVDKLDREDPRPQLESLTQPLGDVTRRTRSVVHTRPAVIELAGWDPQGRAELRVVISEGRKHQVRKLCGRARLSVALLERTHFGPLLLGDLLPGDARALTAAEVAACRTCAEKRPGVFAEALALLRGVQLGRRYDLAPLPQDFDMPDMGAADLDCWLRDDYPTLRARGEKTS